MKYLIIISILIIFFTYIYYITKKNNSVDLNKFKKKVFLKKSHYTTTRINIYKPTFDSKLSTKYTKSFVKSMIIDSKFRPQGTVVSWRYSDSEDWFKARNHFKFRKISRKTTDNKSLIANPIGWTQRYISLISPHSFVQKDEKSTHLFERGHLAPYWITQDELDNRNLILVTQYTNKGFESSDKTDDSSLYFGAINPETMLAIESEIKHFVVGKGCKKRLENNIFQVMVKPLYLDNNFVPYEIQYTIQLINKNNTLLSFEFLGKHVAPGHCMQINVPVQLSDGTIPYVVEKED